MTDNPVVTMVEDMHPPAKNSDVAIGMSLRAFIPNAIVSPPSNDIFSIPTLDSKA